MKKLIENFPNQLREALEIADAAYFYTESRINFMVTSDGATYPLDLNLDQLEEVLDPARFFRINRQLTWFMLEPKTIVNSPQPSLKNDLLLV